MEKENKANKAVRDIRNLFEHEEENYYKPLRVGSFGVILILIKKEMVIEIKHYKLKNILIKLDHT